MQPFISRGIILLKGLERRLTLMHSLNILLKMHFLQFFTYATRFSNGTEAVIMKNKIEEFELLNSRVLGSLIF